MHSIPSKYFHSYYMTIRFLRNLRSLIFLIFLFLLVCFHVMLMTLYQLWALHFACHIRMSHAKSIHFLSIIYLSQTFFCYPEDRGVLQNNNMFRPILVKKSYFFLKFPTSFKFLNTSSFVLNNIVF